MGRLHRGDEYFVSPIEDDPERKNAELALRKSEANFRALFDQAPEGIFIADVDGRCTDVNVAARQMLGYEREELIGHTVFDILAGEDGPRLVDARKTSPAADWVEVWEWMLKRKDGVLIPVEVTAKTLPDGRWQAFVRDISRRREREEELRKLTSLLDSIVENVPAMIFMKDAKDLRFERFNRAGEELLGIPREELLGKNDHDLFTEEQADFFRARDREALDERKLVLVHEEPIRTATGIRWLHTMKLPIVDGVGTPAHLLGISMDITDRRCAERESEGLRAEWGSIVAHDLRQPLQSITLSAQILARSTNNPTLLKYIERVRSSADRMDRMVADLMDFSRLDARRLELSREPMDVTAIVWGAVERMAPQAPDRPFEVNVKGGAQKADVDADRIAQVMENLLTNAVKYGSAETPISVRVTHDDEEIAVAVTNHGKPLTPDELPRLFERFHRTAGARQGPVKGAGLGLYITRALVEAHGGRISAESTPTGLTTFRFTLPVAQVSQVIPVAKASA